MPGLARLAAAMAVGGVILNRLNVSVLAFNYDLPGSQRYYPHWMEYVVVLFLVTLSLLVFKLAVERLAILKESASCEEQR